MDMLQFSDTIHQDKHRLEGESFRQATARVAGALADNDPHFHAFRQVYRDKFFMPAGRVQRAMGAPQIVTAFNCFVGGAIEDSMGGIMDKVREGALTMKSGGGLGNDFSPLRPSGANIATLSSPSSGAVSFMGVFDAMGATVSSAGNRRGAQMGVLVVHHPDIEAFVSAKTTPGVLGNFNLSVGITDEFMYAVRDDISFDLRHSGIVYKTVSARALWDKIMRATWDWAEPGVLFIDRINGMNNLQYCETIAATNPCGEQPLPPYGACLLGSFNLTGYEPGKIRANMGAVLRAMDNVIDRTIYPLPQYEAAAKDKRRIGLGVMGLANYIEKQYDCTYGDDTFLGEAECIFKELRDAAYYESVMLAKEKGSFPAYDREQYLKSNFVATLPSYLQEMIAEYGIRNSHLISFAPTGTLACTVGNVSSGIEPVFSHSYQRTIKTPQGDEVFHVQDYNVWKHELYGKTSGECSPDEHLAVLALATEYCDSAVSKTVNVGDDIQWDEFKNIYHKAWLLGCKGVTTFRAAGKRFGVLVEEPVQEGAACYIDPDTGIKSCD